jgi:DNA polymerase
MEDDMPRLTLDFETRSTIELTAAGPWKYAAHETTQVIVLSVLPEGGEPLSWIPPWVQKIVGDGDWLKDSELVWQLKNADKYEAHNMEFERAMWEHVMVRKYGFPPLDLDRCSCTAARAAVQALPRRLEDVCNVLGTLERKDSAGHALMIKMCKPRQPRKAEKAADPDWEDKLYWRESREDMLRLIEYCEQDCRAEDELSEILNPLMPFERTLWLHDQVVNHRGLFIDIPAVKDVVKTLAAHENRLLKEIMELTDYVVDSPRQIAASIDWMSSKGVHLLNMQKNTIQDTLDNNSLPPEVRRFLEIRQELGRSSTSKFTAMLDRAQEDQRARSTIMHHGANTGRPTGKSIQPLNMPRESYLENNPKKSLAVAREVFATGDPGLVELLLGQPFASASMCLRGSISAAPGNDLIAADYSSIEARGNAWAAGEEPILEAFRADIDVYRITAADTFGISPDEVDDERRTIGKVEDLALGYGGGIGSLVSMSSNYNLDLETLPPIIKPLIRPEDMEGKWSAINLAKRFFENNPEAGDKVSYEAAIACDIIKRRWRENRPMTVKSWRGYEQAAKSAVLYPGQEYHYRYISYVVWQDTRGNSYLLCRLPSGRILYYFDPKLHGDDLKSTLSCMSVDSETKRWVRRPLYGGLLCENNVQALCRCLHTEAMIRLEQRGYPVVLHVYDEIVAEVREGTGSLEEFTSVMTELPHWAQGFPVKAVGWRGKHFRK